jgi:hypothetical protein
VNFVPALSTVSDISVKSGADIHTAAENFRVFFKIGAFEATLFISYGRKLIF